jgi:DNA (cytosine-5)-methyltransferase 1
MKHLGDITLIDGSKIEPVDVITFGSPCQDLSIAGKRAGLAGQRSGLFMEAVRIIKQMQEATNGEYPKYAVWENVPGAFSSNKGKDFLAVLEELIRIKEPTISLPEPPKSKWSKAGEVSGSGWSLAWRTMDAQYWGVPQRRLRISLVLDLTGQRAGEILFEPESLRGHFAPSITPGQATAGAVENGAGTANRVYAEVNNVCAFKLGNSEQARSIGYAEELVPTLNAECGGNKPACAYTLKIRSGCEGGGKGALVQTEKSATLSTLQDQTLFVAEPTFCIQGNTINCYAATTEPNMIICNDCSPAIRSRDYKDPNIVCYDARGNGDGMLSPTITGDHNSRITDYTAVVIEKKIIRWIVRRLTPTECERLQGYPDGWTDLGEWVDSKGKAHKAADAPRYKALGNSIALPQWYYVLGGIADRLPDNATIGSLFDGIGGFPYVWAQLHAGRKELCVWASEIEEFPIAVTKVHFPES